MRDDKSFAVVGVQVEFDDTLNAISSENGRDANENITTTVLAVEESTNGEDTVLIADDGLYHFANVGTGSMPTTAAKMRYNLIAAQLSAADDTPDLVFRQEITDGDAPDGGVARHRNHGGAMTTHYESLYVLGGDMESVGDKRLVSSHVEQAAHAHDPCRREIAALEDTVTQDIQWVGHYDDNAIGSMQGHLASHILDNSGIGGKQLAALHTGFSWGARGDDHNIGTSQGAEIGGDALHYGVEPLEEADWRKSRALPSARPGMVSMIVISLAKSRSAIAAAQDVPTWPAPIIETLLMFGKWG